MITKKKIKVLVKDHKYIYIILKLLNSYLVKLENSFFYSLSYVFSYILPINNNKIVIKSFYGRGYGSSSKYIVEEILRQQDGEVDIVWLCSEKSYVIEFFPHGVRPVHATRIKEIYELATAKIWVDDCRKIQPIYKRNKQFYLQTWHSPLRPKKIEKDAGEYLHTKYIKGAKNDSKNIDLMISGCEFSHNIYRNSFWYDGLIEKTGTPRCDIFFNDVLKLSEQVKNFYSIPLNAQIILYAPTFRMNEKYNYSWGFDKLINAYSKKTGIDTYLLVRLHPNVAQQATTLKYSKNVINATYYPDMQELLCACEILITDYSSSMFDIAIARKKCILYTPDLTKYLEKERELYFDLSKLPFPMAKKEEHLLSAIQSLDQDYFESLEKFLVEIGNYEDGKASERVANLLLSKLSN